MNNQADRRRGWARWQRRAAIYGLALGVAALFIYWPGSLSFLPGCGRLRGACPLSMADRRLGDALQLKVTPVRRTSEQPVCVVAVTEQDLGMLPAPRSRKAYAELVGALREAGAKVIALNLPFEQEQPDDAALAREMRLAGNVVLTRFGREDGVQTASIAVFGNIFEGDRDIAGPPARNADGSLELPLGATAPSLHNAARAVSHSRILRDGDGVARRVPAAVSVPGEEGRHLPLGVACAMLAEGLDPRSDAMLEKRSLRFGQVSVPLDSSGCIPISFVPLHALIEQGAGDISRVEAAAGAGRTAPVQLFSLGDVVSGRAPRSAFKDAVVLVGQCSPAANGSLIPTPAGNEYNVLVQATLVDAVLNRRFLSEAGDGWIALTMLLLSVMAGSVCFAARFKVNGYVAAGGGVVAFVLGGALILAVVAWTRGQGVVLAGTPYLLVLGLNLATGVAVNAVRTARDARRRDREMELLLLAGRRQDTELHDQDTPRTSAIPGAAQMAISASLSLRSPEIVAETLCQGIPCQGCVLFCIPEGQTLSFDHAVYHAFSAAYSRQEVERIAVRFAWETLKQGHPMIHSRHKRGWMFPDTNPIYVNLLGVPVIARGQPLAVAVLFNKRATSASPEREFTEDHLRLVSALRYQAAALLENARRYQLEYAMFDGFARSLAKAVDFRDNYTRGHSERVAALSAGIACELGLTEGEVETVRRAATLHDLGKIGVNDVILRKPGRLSEGESSMIRAHAANGFEILKAAPSFEALLPGIRHHHERYDGAGYPDGLAGNSIPLIARIIAVADAFDAMTSNRPYRKALPDNKAREEMRAGSGTQFDPQIVEALISYLDKRGTDESGEVTQTASLLAVAEANGSATEEKSDEPAATIR